MNEQVENFESSGGIALRLDARKMYETNGLIDDFVVYGAPEDYLLFAQLVERAIDSRLPTPMLTTSEISIEITCNDFEVDWLFTSLQNEDNEYWSMEDWDRRNILRVMGNATVLASLRDFLRDVSTRGPGYSILSEYSDVHEYCPHSPRWRLHVEDE